MDAFTLQSLLGKHWDQPATLESEKGQIWVAWNGARELLSSFMDKKEALLANPDYTREGKAKQLTAMAKASLADLAKVRSNIITGRKASLPQKREAAKRTRPTVDPVLAYLKAQETRAHLLSLADGDLVKVLHNARRDDDLETLEAAVGIPSFRRPATAPVNWKDLEAYVARVALDPVKLAELEDLEADLNRSESALAVAEREIKNAIGLDELHEQAYPEGVHQ